MLPIEWIASDFLARQVAACFLTCCCDSYFVDIYSIPHIVICSVLLIDDNFLLANTPVYPTMINNSHYSNL